MIEFHAITPHGRELVAQVVDGKLVIPAQAGTPPAVSPTKTSTAASPPSPA